MDFDDVQIRATALLHEAALAFHKVPGSAVLIRYVQSSYQNDPIRSAIELVLVIFFIRYLLAPSYPTHKQNFIKLREDVRLCGSAKYPVGQLTSPPRRSTSSSTNGCPSPWLRLRRLSRRPRPRSCPLLLGKPRTQFVVRRERWLK